MKPCTKCGTEKPLDDFYKDARQLSGRMSWCRSCHKAATWDWQKRNRDKHRQSSRKYQRARDLKRNYGLTLEDYDAMFAEQGGVCAICGFPETAVRKGVLSNLCVDHCHLTGKIRGLLCNACNRSIGKMGDDPDRLERAAAYLRSHLVGGRS